MKKKTLKRVLAAALVAAMSLSLAACGGESASETENTSAGTEASSAETADSTETEASGESLKIAVVKQMDHASLDEIADAITAELDTIAEENGIEIEYAVYSGQGEQSVLQQIGDQAIADEVDAIIPIATLAAQVMTACAEDSQTPVIYAAISDPETAELTDISYVTGTSDALNTTYILDMMRAADPDLQKVGLLYSPSEANSATPIEEAKAYLDENNIEYVEATGNTNDEVIAAASVLISEEVDAIFTPTDNVVMAAELSIADTLIEAGIPHYTGADSFVRNGAFTTCGVNYTDLGTKTADLAYQAITEGMDDMDDYYLMDGGIVTVNTETADGLKMEYSVFEDYGDIVEVVTTED